MNIQNWKALKNLNCKKVASIKVKENLNLMYNEIRSVVSVVRLNDSLLNPVHLLTAEKGGYC